MRNLIHRILSSALLTILCCSAAAAEDAFHIDEMVVIPIDVVEVPATRSGKVVLILATEGDEVQQGQVIGSLDDRLAILATKLAENELQIAKRVATSDGKIQSAELILAGEKQTAKRLAIVREIANHIAKNELRILATQKSEAAAENEYRRAASSRQQYAESVSKSELESLRLAVEKSRLETKQARFEQRVAGLEVQAETESSKRQQLLVRQAQAELDTAATDAAVLAMQVQNRQAQLEIAKANLNDHRLISPINGRVTKVFKKPGAWATEGEPLLRIVRLDRLRVEGYASLDQLDSIATQSTVELKIQTSDKEVQWKGEVVFIDPEIDPVNGEFRFWVDFDNPGTQVLPGMRASAGIRP